MFDARLRPLIDPPLNKVGGWIAVHGITANLLTMVGLGFGLTGAVLIGFGAYGPGLVLVIANRLLDGLDGAVARAAGPTDFGGYLDIVADFAFYVSVPLAFGFAAPGNLPYAIVLVASFILTGVSFLAFAAISAKRGETTEAHGRKSFFYSTGLAEGTETIIVFIAMCIFPSAFPAIAAGYAVLCIATVFQRTAIAASMFR